MVVVLDVAPTANASGRLAGELSATRRRRQGRTIVAGGGHREDVRGAQRLQVGLEFEVAPLPCAPGEVDDVGSIVREQVAVGVEQPLEGEVDRARRADARVVEGPRGDELGTGRHADAGAGDDHARDLGAVAAEVCRS